MNSAVMVPSPVGRRAGKRGYRWMLDSPVALAPTLSQEERAFK
jgi:hypothetical protein